MATTKWWWRFKDTMQLNFTFSIPPSFRLNKEEFYQQSMAMKKNNGTVVKKNDLIAELTKSLPCKKNFEF